MLFSVLNFLTFEKRWHSAVVYKNFTYMFRHLWETIFSCNNYNEEAAMSKEADPPKYKQIRPTLNPIEPNKHASDIEALEGQYGELKKGLIIETTLQDLLQICPRKRKRTEAYQGLISYLKKIGVTLIINSNKTKNGKTGGQNCQETNN